MHNENHGSYEKKESKERKKERKIERKKEGKNVPCTIFKKFFRLILVAPTPVRLEIKTSYIFNFSNN